MPVGVYEHKKGWHHSAETKEKIRLANTGKIHSVETKKKQSEAKKKNPTNYWLGKKRPSPSDETKKKMSDSHKRIGSKPPVRIGEANNKWKGGISKIDKLCRTMPEYIRWRSCVFARDNWKCQDCGIEDVYVTAHHKKGFSGIIKENKIIDISSARECKELWDTDNGITLCEDCHKITDNYCGRAAKGQTRKVGVA